LAPFEGRPIATCPDCGHFQPKLQVTRGEAAQVLSIGAASRHERARHAIDVHTRDRCRRCLAASDARYKIDGTRTIARATIHPRRQRAMSHTRQLFTAAAAALFVSMPVAVHVQTTRLHYPESRKSATTDDYFGTKVADPYRWMENLDSKEVAGWVAAENKVTSAYLAQLPRRDRLRDRITELWNYPKTGIPRREGGRYFYTKNSGLQRQSPIYVRASLDAPPSIVIDPNTLSADGSISLAQWAPSPDGRLLAYGLSQGGADWETIHVRDLSNGRDLPDEVKWMRFSGLSWTKDGKGFFYSRYPEPPQGRVLEAALSGQALYYHRAARRSRRTARSTSARISRRGSSAAASPRTAAIC
jgi:prolyl oligopeptidase family protein